MKYLSISFPFCFIFSIALSNGSLKGGGNSSGEGMMIAGGRGRLAQAHIKRAWNKARKKRLPGFFILMPFWRNEKTKKAAAETAGDVREMGDIARAKGFYQLVANVQR
jgi:hypothetical protein